MFVPGNTFLPSIMFVSKAGAYPSGTNIFSGVVLKGGLLALPTNIKLDWKRFPGTNTLAYYEYS